MKHVSEQGNWILEVSSSPSMVKNPRKASTVRSLPTQSKRVVGVDLIDQGEVLVALANWTSSTTMAEIGARGAML
jgi:hypothetical protein